MRNRLFHYIRILFFGSATIFWSLLATSSFNPLAAQQPTQVFEDFEHNDPFNNRWFIFFGPHGIGDVEVINSDRGLVQHTQWSSLGQEGYIGGFGREKPSSLSGHTHFTFWINPIKGSNFTLEVNLQEDDNGDGKITTHEDDEFQFDVIVSDIGPGAVAGRGWQQVIIPLTDFYDDNSYLRGGNGLLDAIDGHTKLINVVFSIINHTNEEIEFLTDDWSFSHITNPQNQRTDQKILFVGNSYTFYNNMPQLFYKLAVSGGKNVLVDQSTFAGYWLENHLSNEFTAYKLQKENWDYVIIQEQSQVPTVKYWREASMEPAAEILNSIVKEGGAETVLFMTWGRKHGGEQWLNDYTSSDFVDFNAMQDSLEIAYRNMADYLEATLAPVGLAWEYALIIKPELNLWDEDLSHPTYIGSYLTACVFYATIFGESPVGLDFSGELSAENAWFLQTMASTALVEALDDVSTR